MPRVTRAALIQARNDEAPGSSLETIKQTMIDKHVHLIAQAAERGAQVVCLQELFNGPYFCAEQSDRWYALTQQADVPSFLTAFAALCYPLLPAQQRSPALLTGLARAPLPVRQAWGRYPSNTPCLLRRWAPRQTTSADCPRQAAAQRDRATLNAGRS